MHVPMYTLEREYLQNKEEYQRLFDAVCSSAAFADGTFTHRFEEAFGAFLGGAHVSAVSNGTGAIFLALRALGVVPGDEVIVPSATFTATPGAVQMAGATPVFVDCDPETWEISPAEVAEKLTAKTKAVLGVHLYGNLFDTSALRSLTRDAGVLLLEDCAQAAGAEENGKKAGCFGDAACFSFYPTKNLGAFGEGGAVVSADPAVIDRVSSLKKHARTPEGDHTELGYNLRMDGLQGAVLTHKLETLEPFVRRKNEIAARYLAALGENPLLIPQKVRPGVRHAYHLFVLKAHDRERFRAYMAARDVETAVQYPVPCHLQTVFAAGAPAKGALPVTEQLFDHCVSLPCHPLLTDAEAARVAAALADYRG